MTKTRWSSLVFVEWRCMYKQPTSREQFTHRPMYEGSRPVYGESQYKTRP